MNEKRILEKIKNECESAAPDDFESLRKNIEENCESGIVFREKRKFSISYIRYAGAAAAIFIPAAAAVFINRAGNPETDIQEINQASVLQTSYAVTTSSEESDQTDFQTQQAVTAAVTELTSAVSSVSEKVTVITEIRNTEQETKQEAAAAESSEADKPAETQAPLTTQPEEQSVLSESLQTEPDNEPVSDDFSSVLMMVPGKTDMIFRLERKNAGGENFAVYQGNEGRYRVMWPESYTVTVYEVIVYGFDYFDFLNKGDYVLKTETEYTLDEILGNGELLSVEDLISAGLYAEKE